MKRTVISHTLWLLRSENLKTDYVIFCLLTQNSCENTQFLTLRSLRTTSVPKVFTAKYFSPNLENRWGKNEMTRNRCWTENLRIHTVLRLGSTMRFHHVYFFKARLPSGEGLYSFARFFVSFFLRILNIRNYATLICVFSITKQTPTSYVSKKSKKICHVSKFRCYDQLISIREKTAISFNFDLCASGKPQIVKY